MKEEVMCVTYETRARYGPVLRMAVAAPVYWEDEQGKWNKTLEKQRDDGRTG